MNGIVIGIDPTIAQIRPFTLRWYSLFFVGAVVAGVWLGLRECKRKGISVEQAQTLAVWAVVGGMIGARLFHVIDRWELYAANPLSALNLAQGGLVVEGGLVGGFLAGLVYAYRTRLPIRQLADAAGPGMIFSQALGRFACILNGDAYGAPANVPWAFIYTNPHAFLPPEFVGVPTHPYPAYEMLFDSAHVFKPRKRQLQLRREAPAAFIAETGCHLGRKRSRGEPIVVERLRQRREPPANGRHLDSHVAEPG